MPCGEVSGKHPPKLYLRPLQILQEEHTPLRAQMEELVVLADAIGEDQSLKDWMEPIYHLRVKTLNFFNDLKRHSEREEGYLFPLVARHTGWETGPIAVMEAEHEQAHQWLQHFLDDTNELTGALPEHEAITLAEMVLQAYNTLTDHFAKEENVLFPLAESVLTEKEKDELTQNVQLL